MDQAQSIPEKGCRHGLNSEKSSEVQALARLDLELETCRKRFEKYATEAGGLDYEEATKRIEGLRSGLIDIDHVMEATREGDPARLDPKFLEKACFRIGELREMLMRFSLDYFLRFAQWERVGNLLYYKYDDWDGAMFYWRKAGPIMGPVQIAQAAVDRIGQPVGRSMDMLGGF